MPLVKIDLITEDPQTGEFVLYLVGDGPWPSPGDPLNEKLSMIQHRIFDAVDLAVDGRLAQKFKESIGKDIRVQIDSPQGAPRALQALVEKVRAFLADDREYSSAISRSAFVAKIRVVTGHELGRFSGRTP